MNKINFCSSFSGRQVSTTKCYEIVRLSIAAADNLFQVYERIEETLAQASHGFGSHIPGKAASWKSFEGSQDKFILFQLGWENVVNSGE
jgi:hypothetical protein